MDVRSAVIAALDETCGLLNRPQLAGQALSGGDFALADLDIDSLSTYEVIMSLEESLGIELEPAVIFSSVMLSDVIDAIAAAQNQHA